MDTQTIYTLNARDSILLEFIQKRFNLDNDVMHHQINLLFKGCVDILKGKNIHYSDLKPALIPNTDRREIALVFDINKIKSAWYGLTIFDKIIPLFDKSSTHSVLVGDYIGNQNIGDVLKSEFLKEIKAVREINYQHFTQFYIVYINNLSDSMVERFSNELKEFVPYVGFFDLSNESFIKEYISTILVKLFIKNKNIIIQGHEEDRDNNEDINMVGYSFEENDYLCKSLQSTYYDLFLSYKIERGVYKGFEADTTLSINAISPHVFDISEFNLIIEEPKFEYLLEYHSGRIKKAGMIDLTIKDLEKFIKEKIKSNYIYNMVFIKEHNTFKFNIIVESTAKDTNEIVRLLVALEYNPNSKILRLITMF